ncbi:hypothetical protein CHU93_14195 [Sandarakinorhabdus cyanobacteriorum]|uniref:Uncharacterized protein n=1 Tax=Sandarakinorhabdus cyanobacteriorum TaxID=1981098 RepID=A0A255Y6Z3_9SPHN|nr:hypothetical protein [Sandarakinorhabdus cyanobacteriorum]OYQ24989.1 hypothetical protein CHU93_14195 [Sandarakinorhabdus cyanobacteriorum]
MRALAAGLVLALLPGAAHAAKPKAPAALTLKISDNGNPYMPVVVKNATLNTRIALSYDQGLLLNPSAVARAGVKPFPIIGKFSLNNTPFASGKTVIRFTISTAAPQGLAGRKVPMAWLETPTAADADAILPVGSLAADRIDFVRGETPAGSQTYIIPKKGKGEAMIRTRIGGEEVNISLELNIPTTVMSARAGEALIQAGLASRIAEIGYWRPFPAVSLPMQGLAGKPGLTIAGLPMRRMSVRVSESEARAIDARAKGTSTEEDDEDTITVSADRTRKKRGRDPWILIGRDVLDDCSRISFDRPGERWVLTCKFS